MRTLIAILAWVVASSSRMFAWDYELHRLVNEIALASLPTNFPAFALTPEARERIAFLAGEPDRWRNTPDVPLRHSNGPEHYFDVDDLASLDIDAAKLPPFREDFIVLVHQGRTAHPDRFPPLDPQKDPDHVRWFPGLLPWKMAEDYGRLKSGFSYLKAFEENGLPSEVTNSQANLVYLMGAMGHYLADASQPLHCTHHFNGWTGENPSNFTTSKTFHAWVDGNFLKKVGFNREALMQRVRPARLAWDGDPKTPRTNVFALSFEYVRQQFDKVQPLYQLEKDGKLAGELPAGADGREFLLNQLLTAGQLLGDFWFSAWQQAPPDAFLQVYLARRKIEQKNAAKP